MVERMNARRKGGGPDRYQNNADSRGKGNDKAEYDIDN